MDTLLMAAVMGSGPEMLPGTNKNDDANDVMKGLLNDLLDR